MDKISRLPNTELPLRYFHRDEPVLRPGGQWPNHHAFLKVSNDQTKVVVGHGPLATKADIVAYNAMAKTVRERVEKLFNEGKTEAEVIAADPLKDLNTTWAADAQGATNFLKQVYNSFKRS